jgi:hypothetical protein
MTSPLDTKQKTRRQTLLMIGALATGSLIMIAPPVLADDADKMRHDNDADKMRHDNDADKMRQDNDADKMRHDEDDKKKDHD